MNNSVVMSSTTKKKHQRIRLPPGFGGVSMR